MGYVRTESTRVLARRSRLPMNTDTSRSTQASVQASEAFARRAQLSRKLTTAIAAPLLLLVVVGLLLGRQILAMAEDSTWVEHTDQVLAAANDALRQISEQESAVSNFLLTRDEQLLDPFVRARPLESFIVLDQLVKDNPQQQARFRDARQKYEAWFAIAAPLVATPPGSEAQGIRRYRDGKPSLEAMRALMVAGIEVEEGLRRTRVAAAAESTQRTQLAFVGLISAAALLLAFLSRRQLRSIADSYAGALESEFEARARSENEAWVRAGQSQLVEALQGERTLEQLGAYCLEVLGKYTQADVGAFFVKENGGWRRRSALALDTRAAGPDTFADGEGIIGRAAMDGKLVHLREVPADFLKVRSGTGEGLPAQVVVVPARTESMTHAVLELGFLRPVDVKVLELLGRVGDPIATAV